ncbi:hypothetical protein [Pyrobaculum neutrophilum]|uniref:Uncharacterized protein n=1 Tax=Pyrobaculum neutrophilum (strain DSM 2338 / JCM 9278 / NBRC 100436 / V24Sta) TaxID=444157 RepID=B1Y8R2_PYRNV|nr:hypothetical protein [Pyrobaculum neutrophilum]ACB40141.1 conserved hypothetical protein [Pyrobaculum neutrophilum V24Sta]
MWSTAYGVIAAALVAFALLYAASHTPYIAGVNTADQLYFAKASIGARGFNYTQDEEVFQKGSNVARALVVNITTSSGLFPAALPLGYKAEGRGGPILYQIYVNLIFCKRAPLPSGGSAYLYAIELRHSVDVLPWIEVEAPVGLDLGFYRQLWLKQKRPPVLGVPPPPNATYVLVPKALVYNATGDVATLYVEAPSPLIYIVDYPLKLPIACPTAFA